MTATAPRPGPRVVALGPRPETGLLSTTAVGSTNRARVLQALADHGPLSRADLARHSGVTRASIGGVAAGLLTEGVLHELESGTGGSRRIGKPSRPLWFADRGPLGAVVLQPGVVEVGVVASDGRVSVRESVALPPVRSAAELDAAAVDAVRTVLGPTRQPLIAVGLALPGFFGPDGEILVSTTIDTLPGSRLPALLAAATGTTVVLEDDARALALGQRWFGQARGVRDFAALQIGAGIGAGIMLDGRLLRGPLVASEVGHMTVDHDGELCRCGQRGCWETLASSRWLHRRSEQAGLPEPETMTPRRLTELADTGDPAAAEVLDDYAGHVALGIVNLFHVLSIPLFILHGPIVEAGPRFLDRLREHVAARTMSALNALPTITMDENATRSGVLGAAAAAITHQLGVSL
ncbi:ROK family transcriptional regulator [Jiangella asiatica]|uniref:ROK family transcriptional regulator n=1 Tax=Jiangella asiatica TaxID=2530372 RepID=A0A4R5D4B1_9ACTN|nr:ROK family transcriptional regulator [Jiangella asiatica]TDE08126.1 ROK family transcriptional regulator [Jiangella asiatica]